MKTFLRQFAIMFVVFGALTYGAFQIAADQPEIVTVKKVVWV